VAKQFVLLDNFYVDGEVSADGHEWSTAAYATDFVEKSWPLSYRRLSPGGKIGYPAEGAQEKAARPAGGLHLGPLRQGRRQLPQLRRVHPQCRQGRRPGKASVKALEGHFDPLYRSYDLDLPRRWTGPSASSRS